MIWRFRDINQQKADYLAQTLRQPQKLGEFLSARGFREPAEVESFIRAKLPDLPGPMTLTDMDKAAERLLEAQKKGELVAVCGDYDADGVTATALLHEGLTALGHNVTNHIPNRLTAGYGLKPESIAQLSETGVTVIVTVDNGISDYEAVEKARLLGIDVIITDHHRLPPVLPRAVAIINPHRDESWKNSPLAGVGVAFMLLAALKKYYQEAGLISSEEGPVLVKSLALVAIGTIADLVPLTGANRILVRQGLIFLSESNHPGLTALKQNARLGCQNRISPRDVAFKLAPRLNAAGRLGSSRPALDLLLARNDQEAKALAGKLEELNRERHAGQNRLCAEALERLEVEINPDSRTVVMAGDGWPKGLLGLAASRVAETTRKPTILFSVENGVAVGSGRSAGGFNLYAALDKLRHLYLNFGGHAQAAGLTLEHSLMDEFKARFEEAAADDEKGVQAEEDLWVDCLVSLKELDLLAKPLAALEPFGQGHPTPVVVIKKASILDARPTDSRGDQHMKMTISDGLTRHQVVGFNLAPRLYEICREMDVALSLDLSEFKGQTQLNWRLLDFQSTAENAF